MAESKRSIYDTYARKLLDYFDVQPGDYDIGTLNELVLSVPFAEAHVVDNDLSEKSLPRLGEGLSVQDHMRRCFFDMVNSEAPLFMMTSPFLIKREFLEALEHWREWRVLTLYLLQFNLDAAIAFRNRPIALDDRDGAKADYYLGDVRVFCAGDSVVYAP